jgi:acyl-CoA reductase-like NAD-dependent aldehyde dehydrogenase
MARSPIRSTSLIDAKWQPFDESRAITRENPGRISEIAGRWTPATAGDAQRATNAAAAALPLWAVVPLAERIDLLNKLFAAVETHADDFAATITRENGKPLRDSLSEVAGSLRDSRYPVFEAARLGVVETISTPGAAITSEQILEPLGVCLLITPWNFPLATVLRKLAPALLFGNTAIVKPSELTPATACLLFSLIESLPFPRGVAQLVLGTGGEVGPALIEHPALRAISFTGSNATGANLSRATAGRDVRLQLEMGGKNSLVVLADADIDAAVEAAAIGGFTCAGQWCTGTGRVIVQQPVHDEFVSRLLARITPLRVGPGDDPKTDVGPVVTADRVAFAHARVAEAIAAGARVHGGGTAPSGGHFVMPTILDHVTETMRAFTEELFVPVLPIAVARDADDALRLANTGRYGLSASIFSRDIERAAALARWIEAGIVHVNLHTAYREPSLSVAGWRESGRGLPECGRFARDFFTRPRAFYQRNS